MGWNNLSLFTNKCPLSKVDAKVLLNIPGGSSPFNAISVLLSSSATMSAVACQRHVDNHVAPSDFIRHKAGIKSAECAHKVDAATTATNDTPSGIPNVDAWMNLQDIYLIYRVL